MLKQAGMAEAIRCLRDLVARLDDDIVNMQQQLSALQHESAQQQAAGAVASPGVAC